jgi:Ti-type conjugative transfer relaxase TraA
MAIYHFTVKVMSRSEGRNAVAGATYRHGQNMTDEKTGRVFTHSTQQDVEHCELSIPENAPEWAKELLVGDVHENSEKLWNAVEQFEKRVDAQVYRDVEFSLPHELSAEQRLILAREFIQDQFVSKGMIADWCVHNHFDETEGIEKPHVHVMLTMREAIQRNETILQKLKSYVGLSAGSSGMYFSPKVTEWNSKFLLRSWREQWADHANVHLAKAGLDIRIDHRSYEDQGIELIPQPKLGKSVHEMSQRGLPIDRFEEMKTVQRRNRALIRKKPEIVIDYITRYQSTFTRQDIARVLNRYIDNPGEFQNLLGRIEASSKLVILNGNEKGEALKLTTQERIRVEKQIVSMASEMALKHSCPPHLSAIDWYIEKGNERLKEHGGLSKDQVQAIGHMVSDGQLKVIVGYAGAGKTTCLEVGKEIWGSSGYKIVGAAPTGKAASNLEGIGIASKTLHKWEQDWGSGKEKLHSRSILILDEAGMVDSERLHTLFKHSKEQGFKIVLVGDPEQLSPIEAGAPTRAILETVGFAELSSIVRQKVDWQKEASHALATRQTMKALEAYQQKGHIHYSQDAKETLIKDWAFQLNQDRDKGKSQGSPSSSLILAYTNQDVQELNQLSRQEARASGFLQGHDRRFTVSKPLNLETLDKPDIQDKGFKPRTLQEERKFAVGDSLVFLRNDYGLNVKNGQLGKITQIQEELITVMKEDKTQLTFDMGTYNHLDHGYATTIHKSQGSTVDKTFVYASPYMDKHLTYVALTRHKEDVQLYVNTDVIPSKTELFKALSKEAPKENTLDYFIGNNQGIDLTPEDQKAFMQRRFISGSPPSSSWDFMKDLTHQAVSHVKEWMFGEKAPSQENRSVASSASSESKAPESRDYIQDYLNLDKQRKAFPNLLYCSFEQEKELLSTEQKMRKLAVEIEKQPALLEKTTSLGITQKIKSHAELERKEISKSLSKDRGIGLSLEITRNLS